MTRHKISVHLLAAELLFCGQLTDITAKARYERPLEPPTEPKEPTPTPQVRGFEQELAHAAFHGFEPYELPMEASPPCLLPPRRRSKGGQRRATRKEWWRR